ncbi:hypothetical protein IE81DRAFT_68773 [Ceraceosorus guamensis]|uniref:DNA-directed RNA polymerase III subunit n=1 Tax=Ceraceosorus guamensis TaxID=1522189 RepID=A0A316VNL0_9BASI|nr:hypothetical protein IE81DRAFT_68773 [Ceraceosorus guamensis]PWN38894.1 hypothetical protein IE81DRAFT_68773 [Ceraceosorus guamensis]
MSRGGMGRGARGGGRGRGRGGGTDLLSSTGQFSYDEIRSGMNSKSQSSIYPVPPSHAITPVPQVSELRAATAQLALLQEMKLGPFWPGMQDDPQNAAASTSASTTTTTTTERKSGLELPRYSDRYKPKALNAPSSHGSGGATGPSLTSLILQREVFPQILWKSYMQGEERREALRAAKATSKKRARVDWDSFERGGGSKAVGAGAAAAAGAGGDGDEDVDQDKDEEEELDAYEDDEDEGDYAAEDYFDDGDGDDEDALDSYARGARGGGNADGEYD